jgi:PKD repeat protein
MGNAQSSGGGWIKGILGSVAGLLSGAVLMYLTPLVDLVVKPGKPMANFGYHAVGLDVTFDNRSAGVRSGWWDFGDGSPLEPVAPGEDIVQHTYPSPGEYTARLTVRNLLNEESERTVVVRLQDAKDEAPAIADFELVPVSPGSYAPATFRAVARVAAAQVCVWDVGDGRPPHVATEPRPEQERLVTFDKPGAYAVRLVAVNGSQTAVKSGAVQVNAPPAGAVTTILSVADQATRVETLQGPYTFTDQFAADARDAVHPINRQAPAKPGHEIADVHLRLTSGQTLRMQGKAELALDAAALGLKGARNLKLQMAPDRRSVRLTGELVRETGGKRATPTSLVLPVVLVQQKKTPAARAAVPVAATLTVPGSTLLTLPPVPADWVNVQRQSKLELRDGDRLVWQDTRLPAKAVVTVGSRRCQLTATPEGDRIRLNLTEMPVVPVSY